MSNSKSKFVLEPKATEYLSICYIPTCIVCIFINHRIITTENICPSNYLSLNCKRTYCQANANSKIAILARCQVNIRFAVSNPFSILQATLWISCFMWIAILALSIIRYTQQSRNIKAEKHAAVLLEHSKTNSDDVLYETRATYRT